jgi:hypothetical protein
MIDNPQFHYLNAKRYSDAKYPASVALGNIGKRIPSEKVRIGYFSADFYNHAIAYLSAELFELHDKSKFETFGFSLGPNKNDEMQRRISKTFTKFIHAESKSDKELAQIAREMEIDIAIDLTGYTRNSRPGIFSYRAAPIQVSYLGYPGTMGAQYIDYIIADQSVIPPENRPFFSEKVVYLPHSYQVNDSKRRISERKFTKQELGLPENGFIFCCFNNNHKIMPETFACWMRILQATPGSVLWLLQDNHTAASNLRKEAEAMGVENSRLIFAQRIRIEEHLARQRIADLFIDTLPYNAHTTASDALWVGLPVLTCLGKSFASRVASSLLNSIGLPELIAQSQEEYESKAIKLASHPEMLVEIKHKLLKNRLTHPLFNTKIFVRHIETAYIKMYQLHQEGYCPDHICVNDEEFSSF